MAGRLERRVGETGAEQRPGVWGPRRIRRHERRQSQSRHDADEGGIPPQERRALQRGRRAHRVLPTAFGSWRSRMVHRHDRCRGSEVPHPAVHHELVVQA